MQATDVSSIARSVLTMLARSDEWDLPAQLFALYDTGGAVLLRDVPLDDGHPADALVGVGVPDDAFGVLFVTEGWQSPAGPAPIAPSTHPARVEIRIAHVMLRNRAGVAVVHTRGGDIVTLDGGGAGDRTVGGRIPDFLARVLGIEPPGAPVTGGHLLLATWATAISAMLGDVDDLAALVLATDPLLDLDARCVDRRGGLTAHGARVLPAVEDEVGRNDAVLAVAGVYEPALAGHETWAGAELCRRAIVRASHHVTDVMASVAALDPSAADLWAGLVAQRHWGQPRHIV